MKARHLPLLLAGFAPLLAAEPAGRWIDHAIERSWVGNYALSLAVELPLASESFGSKLTAGLAWHF